MKNQIPLLSGPVTLNSRFTEIFGDHPSEVPEPERRHRWATWMRQARQKNTAAVTAWTDNPECDGCRHRRGHGWCGLIGLPCTVNPYLTFRTGAIGMACMGAGYEGNQ